MGAARERTLLEAARRDGVAFGQLGVTASLDRDIALQIQPWVRAT